MTEVWIVTADDGDYYGHSEHIIGLFGSEAEPKDFTDRMLAESNGRWAAGYAKHTIGEHAKWDGEKIGALWCLDCMTPTLEKRLDPAD